MKPVTLLTAIVCLGSAALLSAANRDPINPPASRPALRKLPAKEPAASLEAFLASAPTLKEHLVWTTGDGKHEPFDTWSAAQKSRLESFYTKLLANDANLEIHLPTADKIQNPGYAYYTVDQAFDLYAAHAAHVLYVEAQHLVPWSIQSRPAVELDMLLASASYFSRIGKSKQPNQYPKGIEPGRDFRETPEDDQLGEWLGDPRVGYDFLAGKTSSARQKLIADNEVDTLVNLTAWLRDNVGHGAMPGQEEIDYAKTHRFLRDRLRPAPHNHLAFANVGCHSASKLMVDLARSVNIPLLHVRAFDASVDPNDSKSYIFSGSHGGLIYDWGSAKPRVLWHTDDLYAMPGDVCFPMGAHATELLPPDQANRLFFDENWVSPQTLRKAGFDYRLERGIPGKGLCQATRGDYEDRIDFGMIIGRWKKKGNSRLDFLYDACRDYALCGDPFLRLGTFNDPEGALVPNLKEWKGDFTDAELPLVPSVKDQIARATAGIKTLGGPEKFRKLCDAYEKSRGQNLLKSH